MFFLINIILILFLLGAALFWATEGFFSALLHLVLVIIAATLAFALWEPAAYLMLMTERMASHYAWGVSLGLLFVVVLILLRMGFDRLVPKNVQLPTSASQAGGFVCGLAAAWLTAGVALLALSFMPLADEIAGYKPYNVDGMGRVVEHDQRLWLAPDRSAASFFGYLSARALSPTMSDQSLASAYPKPIEQATLFRLRYDPNASLVASPESVSVESAYEAAALPEGADPETTDWLSERFDENRDRLVVVDTAWTQVAPTFDGDDTLRVPPTQIRLITQKSTGSRRTYEVHGPVAFSYVDGTIDGERRFMAAQDNRTSAYGLASTEHLGWVFVVPQDEEVRTLTVRNLRFDLRGRVSEAAQAEDGQVMLATLLGHLIEQEQDQRAGGSVAAGPGQVEGPGGVILEHNTQLPVTMSRSLHRGMLRLSDGNRVQGGNGLASQPSTSISQHNRIEHVHEASHQRILRSEITADQWFRLVSHSSDEIALLDEQGNRAQVIGYVLAKPNGDQRFDFDNRVQTAGDLPRTDISHGDRVFLYFRVSPGGQTVRFTEYRIGEHSATIDFSVN